MVLVQGSPGFCNVKFTLQFTSLASLLTEICDLVSSLVLLLAKEELKGLVVILGILIVRPEVS